MKMYLAIAPTGFTANAMRASRRTGAALVTVKNAFAVPHCPKPPGRKRRV